MTAATRLSVLPVGTLLLSLSILGIGDAQEPSSVGDAPANLCFADLCPADRLRQIERHILPPPVVDGPNRQATLPEYYWAQNRQLLDRFDQAKEAFRRPSAEPYRAVTLVAGAAGIGKTFLKGEVYSKDFPKETICKFDVAELYADWSINGATIDKPDLCCPELEINRLPSLADQSHHTLRDMLEARNADFYVIDSLDEIHPDDSDWVLEEIEDFVFHSDRKFVHVAVFGRGPAFRKFWHRRTSHREETDIQLFLLNPPEFRTTGDLQVSTWNYHTWKYGLRWAPNGGEAEPMPLADYIDWLNSGFSREGRFASVTCDSNQDMRPDVQDRLMTCARNYPVVCTTLYNLAGNGLIREIFQEQVLHKRAYHEADTMHAYFDRWLVRETKAHGLPSVEKPTNLDLYVRLLEQIAVKYLEEDKVGDDGFFPVEDDDLVAVPHNGHNVTFPVKRIMDRSGVMFSDPRQDGSAKYRFEPIWIHRMLVDMHNDRVAGIHPDYVVGMNSD